MYSRVSYSQINMGREASGGAAAGREENNRLNDCQTFRMSWGGLSSYKNRDEAINGFINSGEIG